MYVIAGEIKNDYDDYLRYRGAARIGRQHPRRTRPIPLSVHRENWFVGGPVRRHELPDRRPEQPSMKMSSTHSGSRDSKPVVSGWLSCTTRAMSGRTEQGLAAELQQRRVSRSHRRQRRLRGVPHPISGVSGVTATATSSRSDRATNGRWTRPPAPTPDPAAQLLPGANTWPKTCPRWKSRNATGWPERWSATFFGGVAYLYGDGLTCDDSGNIYLERGGWRAIPAEAAGGARGQPRSGPGRGIGTRL